MRLVSRTTAAQLHVGAEDRFEVDLLEGLAVLVRGATQPDQQHHGRRVVLRDVQPARGVGRAGRARHEGDARHPRELAPVASAIIAAPPSWRQTMVWMRLAVVQAVERRDEALARHRKQRAAPSPTS